ncbi:MAG: flagellar hook-length control protein FliK [Steroidobacteraceae bacterium]
MIPPSLTTDLPATAAASEPVAPGFPTQTTAADFLLMLAQLIDTASQQVPAQMADPLRPLTTKGTTEELLEGEADPEAVVAMLTAGLPPLQTNVQPSLKEAVQVVEVEIASHAALARATENASGFAATDAMLADAILSQEPARGPDAIQQLAAGAAEVQSSHRTHSSADAMARPVHTPVGTAAWADEIGSRLIVMAEQGKQTASLRLSPEHLGPLEISITMRDDKASVWFGAAHAETRAAIEHALPRLRELFESQGLSLTDSGVFREPPRETAMPRPSAAAADGQSVDETAEPGSVQVRLGLIDAYA